MQKLSLKELNRLSIQEFKDESKAPIVIVLDNLRSALNVGSAFRTCDAFAIEHIHLCGITATPPHREIMKTAIGASQAVDWTHHERTLDVIGKLKAEGFVIVGIEQAKQSTWLQDFSVDRAAKYALVFGNEVEGIQEEVMSTLDYCVEVPQYGTKHSLNISVCLGIVIWEFINKGKYHI